MATMKKTGVYVVEKNDAPIYIEEVATAVPAFIGYTEKAENEGESLLNKPWRITSFAEFELYFGGSPKPYSATHTLYYNMLLFYANGGGACYIVSVGNYTEEIEKDKLEAGLTPLLQEQEPAMIVIPEAVSLKNANDCYALQRAMAEHCGCDTRNRIAILDIYEGYKSRDHSAEDVINCFRDNIGCNSLHFCVAYYPWVNFSILPEEESDNTESNLMQLPVSAVMAGIMAAIDTEKGIWRSPANVGIIKAVSVTQDISNEEQENLNTPMNGKSINAIRSFAEHGLKVWGARTMDGNSLDWRYISVRRTAIMIEESIKNAIKGYAHTPNDANTWMTIKAMIDNFLRDIWKRGGLTGSSPEDAYKIHIEPEIRRITIQVAIIQASKFIEIILDNEETVL